MHGQIVLRTGPDSADLAAKREELAQLITLLSDRELELSTLRHDLALLEARYIREIGALYGELDALNARILELRTLRNPTLAEQEDQCSDQSHGCGAPPPSADLKTLYRDAARRLHPDLVQDPEEQERRTLLMAEANRAYQLGDAEALQRILEDFHYASGIEAGETRGTELLHIFQQLREGKARLSTITLELDRLRNSQIFSLREDIAVAEAHGRDLLADTAETIRSQIRRAERIVASLTGKYSDEIPLPDTPVDLDLSAATR